MGNRESNTQPYDWEFCVPSKLNGDRQEEAKTPWRIRISPQMASKVWRGRPPTEEQFLKLFESAEYSSNVRVALLGRFSTGKTHVLNRLSKRAFPEGALPPRMDGLSFVTIGNAVYIDTPGIGAPSHSSRRQMVDDIVDPLSDNNYGVEVCSKPTPSEILLRNILWSISDVFLLVVGIMTQEEDLAIARAKILADRDHRAVIVVHNWWAVKKVTIEDWEVFMKKLYGTDNVREHDESESGATYLVVHGVKHVFIGLDDEVQTSMHNARVYKYLKMLIVGATRGKPLPPYTKSILYEVLYHCANSLTTKEAGPNFFSVKKAFSASNWTQDGFLQVDLERNFEISRNLQLSLDSQEVCPISIAQTDDKMFIYVYTSFNDSVKFSFDVDKVSGVQMVINGRNPVPNDNPDAIWPYQERAAGRFTRKIRISAEYDTSTIECRWLGKVGCYEVIIAKKVFQDFKGDAMEEDLTIPKKSNDDPVRMRQEDDRLPPLVFKDKGS